VYVLQVVLILY